MKFRLIVIDLFKDRRVHPDFFSEAFVQSLINATAGNGMLFFNVMLEDAADRLHFEQLENNFSRNNLSVSVVSCSESNRVLVAKK